MLIGQRLIEQAPLPEVFNDSRISILYKGAVQMCIRDRGCWVKEDSLDTKAVILTNFLILLRSPSLASSTARILSAQLRAACWPCSKAVSYTHLDVYKRQVL